MGKYDGKKVLVVEDDEDVLTYLSTWLADQGFEVVIARNGTEATERLKIFKPDIITLDIVMPEKTGVKFYRETRNDPKTSGIPIIIITGLQSEFEGFINHRRTAPPPDGYIPKPFGQEDLLGTLDKVLAKKSAAGVA